MQEVQQRVEAYQKQDILQTTLVDTIFFGGGTPSLLYPEYIEKILNLIKKYFTIDRDAEITLECNPAASDTEYFSDYAQLGVNRLSIGVQSFIDKDLKFLGRLHTAIEALNTIEIATTYFNNISIDLIFAIPGQDYHSIEKNLQIVSKLNIQHVSYYSLIYEPNTPLYEMLQNGTINPQDDDKTSEHYLFISRFLQSNGFEHYEISNYAQPGFYCRHNLKYWNQQNTIAFGPSAVGYINGFRYKNTSNLNEYFALLKQNKLPNTELEYLSKNNLLTEYIFLKLRAQGLDFNEFKIKFGFDLYPMIENEINLLITNGFAKLINNLLKLEPKGYYICDEITLRLLGKL